MKLRRIDLIQQKLNLIGSTRFLVKSWDEVSEQTIKNWWIHSKLIKRQEFEPTVIESNIT